MNNKKLLSILLIIVLIISVSTTFICYNRANKSYDAYKLALENYNNSDFYIAQKIFKKISIFSPLKPVAIYREALCANKTGNTSEEVLKYQYLKVLYPKSIITPRAVYSQAKIFYQKKQLTKALREFKFIIKKYPNTKYSIASCYYIALIESEKYKNNQKKEAEIINYLKKYILESPSGIYYTNCLDLLEKYTLSEEEKLLIGKTYLINHNYEKAEKFLKDINITLSWPYLVQIYFFNNKFDKVQEYTINGIKTSPNIITNEQKNDYYKAIDYYLKTFNNKRKALVSLLDIAYKHPSYDYLMYKNCEDSTGKSKYLCYKAIYNQFPKGNFAAESLSNVFYSKVQQEDYTEAIKYGEIHLEKYKKTKSTPKVLYWLAYCSAQSNDLKKTRYYYGKLMKEYPDNYYTYLAFINTNKLKYHIQTNEIKTLPVVFPYSKTNDKLLDLLVKIQDYGFINIFYEDDGFIKSWLLYKEGDYTTSTRLARDAMEKLDEKPDKEDLRWRLVYPIHFYNEIIENSTSATDKTLILSIIREESYFNPNAKSQAGARGLMQLMPITSIDISEKINCSLKNYDDLYIPSINIKLGISYFAYLKSLLSGNNQMSILAYNGGIGSLKNWQNDLKSENFDQFIENIPFPETQNYYKKIYRTYWNYLRIYNGLNF